VERETWPHNNQVKPTGGILLGKEVVSISELVLPSERVLAPTSGFPGALCVQSRDQHVINKEGSIAWHKFPENLSVE
jgi:hypothetical protein